VVLGQQLAGNVEGDAVRAVFEDGLGEYLGGVLQRTVPVRTGATQLLAEAQFGMQRAGVQIAGQMQCRTLAAEPAEVGRMIRVAGHVEDARLVVFDQHATADAAVTAGRGGCLAHGVVSVGLAAGRYKRWAGWGGAVGPQVEGFFTEYQLVAEGADVAVLAHLAEIPAAVAHVSVEAGADQYVILDHQLLVDAADGVAEGDGFGAFAA